MRVEQIGNATLYLGDNTEIMQGLGGVAHVISDPPYEDELHKAMGRIRRNDGQEMIQTLGFDGVNASRADAAERIVRVSNGGSFSSASPRASALGETRCSRTAPSTIHVWHGLSLTPCRGSMAKAPLVALNAPSRLGAGAAIACGTVAGAEAFLRTVSTPTARANIRPKNPSLSWKNWSASTASRGRRFLIPTWAAEQLALPACAPAVRSSA
jgi:hypothetical protein